MTAAMAKELDNKILMYQNELVQVAMSISPKALENRQSTQSFLESRLDTIFMFDSGLFIFSSDGRFLAGTKGRSGGAREGCYRRSEIDMTTQMKAPQISEPFFCLKEDAHPVVMFTAPVLGADGEVVAVLAGVLDLMKENFLGEVAALKIGQSGYFYIFNKSGTLIVHHDRSRILTSPPVGVNKALEKALGGFEGTEENINSQGLPVLSTFNRLKATGWVLSANYPLSEAYAPIAQTRRTMLTFLLLMVASSILVVWVAMRHLMAPLSLFTRHVRAMSGKDTIPSPVQIRSHDEIEELAAAFNRLMEDMGKHKKSVQEEKEFETSLLRHLSLPTFVVDANHRILHWNNACERLTGIRTTGMLGTDQHWRAFFDHKRPMLADLVIDGSDEQMAALYPSCEERNGIFHAEGWYANLNGQDRYLSFYAAPIHNSKGELGAAIETIEDITEQKRAEENIQQALSLLNATLEATADGILVRDLEGKVVTCNRKFTEMWRIPAAVLDTHDDMQLRSFVLDQLQDPDRFMQLTEELYLRPDRESDDTLEFKDGRVFERVSRPQLLGNEIVGRVISFRDVTGRKKAEVELDRVNRALRTLSACNRALVYATDEQSLLIEICQGIVKHGGYRFCWVGYAVYDEAKSVRPVAHAGHEDGYLDAIQVTWNDAETGQGPTGSAIRTGSPCIIREIASDMNFTPWQEEALVRGYSSALGLPLATKAETLGCLTIYAAEADAFDTGEVELLQELAANLAYGITALRTREEHKKADEALRESAEQYRSLVENIDLGITLIDNDYRIIMANSAAVNMFDKPLDEFLHKECFRGFEKRPARCALCPGKVAMETGKPAMVQSEGIRDDGSSLVVKIRAFPVFDADGKANRFIEVIQDITEQIQAENYKRRLEDQLRQSQKFEAIGTLAGGIAHDFNNYLTVITAYCTLMERKTAEGDPLRNYIGKMFSASEKAASLTRNLLAYSRKQALNPRPVELNEIVGKVHNLLSRLLGEDIELTVHPADRALVVMADSLQIEQVLMNLATNARDSMPNGGILQIATDRLDIGPEFIQAHGYGVPGRNAVITVSDTGSGMDEITMERIFEPFFSTKEIGRGTGLGLSMVYGIIKQHNGYINVYSEPGKGTTFRIYLPLTDSEQTQNGHIDPPRREKGSETILLVEDDHEIRTSLHELLEEDGYTIIEAVDGEDGIRKFEEHRGEIQLLLLDVIMPKKTGKEVYEAIRAVAPGVKAIFISGYTADILTTKGILGEDLNLVSKPVSINALSAKIREVLDR